MQHAACSMQRAACSEQLAASCTPLPATLNTASSARARLSKSVLKNKHARRYFENSVDCTANWHFIPAACSKQQAACSMQQVACSWLQSITKGTEWLIASSCTTMQTVVLNPDVRG